MQKLEQRTEKNTPTNTPPARSDCGLSLNRNESLSVADLKTRSNNPEVDIHQRTGELKAVVYVISIEGYRLMPTNRSKARKLLKNKKASVVKLYPFTIKLNFVCENQVQGIELGLDPGYKFVGFSAVSKIKELLSGTVILDGKTSDRLRERAMYRRLKRCKLWYRKPRFLNRKKKEGWLPPSIQRRYDAILTLIKQIKAILPISEITVETGAFDIQKIMNPEIAGAKYQQGDVYGYQNERAYLIAREKGLCQICHKEITKGNQGRGHHCRERKNQGTDRMKNIALIHDKCHKDMHRKSLKLNYHQLEAGGFGKRWIKPPSEVKATKVGGIRPPKKRTISAPREFKESTFMNIIRNKFKKDISDVKITFGYETFIKRNELELEKTHYNDAFVIAGGTTQERCEPVTIQQKHRNNRVLQMNRKGFKPSIKRKRSIISPMDLFWVDGKKYVCKSMYGVGKYILCKNAEKRQCFKVINIEKYFNQSSFVWNI